jgi:hypothetical protein
LAAVLQELEDDTLQSRASIGILLFPFSYVMLVNGCNICWRLPSCRGLEQIRYSWGDRAFQAAFTAVYTGETPSSVLMVWCIGLSLELASKQQQEQEQEQAL